MKRAPSPQPGLDRDCARSSTPPATSSTFRWSQDLRRAALGRQPRLHRPEPVVRALRRRGPARLPALRSRPGPGGDVRAGPARPRCLVREALDAPRHAELREDDRLAGHPRLRPDRARPDAEAGLDLRQGVRAAIEARDPQLVTAEYRKVAKRPPRPRARRLQPERLGAHARLDLLGPSEAAATGLDAGHVEGDRARRARSRTSGSTTFPARVAKLGDLWKPLLRGEGPVPPGEATCDAAASVRRFPPMRGAARRRRSPTAGLASTSRSGTGSGASPSVTASDGRAAVESRASRSRRYFPEIVASDAKR